jgi:hypothetical protein
MSPHEFITNENDANLLKKINNALVITTNNIFAEIGIERLCELYEKSPKTIFSIHDYDNHHNTRFSIQSCIFSDVYIPSHQDEYLLASRINPNIIGNIPCGTNQWSREFIDKNQDELVTITRSNDPLGKYYLYERFIHRNKAISTLSQTYPTINIIKTDFHSLTEEEKWQEWAGHKLHWIIPVLNDLPIRFFDALLTGGIPLVPTGLKSYLETLGIPEDFYIGYGPLDLIHPKDVVERSLEKFDYFGSDGIMKRHQYAFKNFHVDVILEKIITGSLKRYGIS